MSIARHVGAFEQPRELRASAYRANRAAADEWRAAARVLTVEVRLSLRDIGVLLGVSHQRAHQLIRDAPGRGDAG